MGLLRRSIWMVGIMLFLTVGSAKGQTVEGYRFETDIDSTLWVDMTNAHRYAAPTQMIDLGFDFFFCGTFYQRLSIDRTGTIGFDPLFQRSDLNTIPPFMSPYMVGLTVESVFWKVVGAMGNRKCVIEYGVNVDGIVRPIQIQISERDGEIVYLYGDKGYSYQFIPFWIGIMGENGSVVSITMQNGVRSEEVLWVTGFYDWPDKNRYYRLVPDSIDCCGFASRVRVKRVTDEQAMVDWRFSRRVMQYEFDYRRISDNNQAWTTIITNDTQVVLSNLLPSTDYEFRVRSICGLVTDSSDWVGGNFKTLCSSDAANLINFSDLYADNVICRVGTYDFPSVGRGVVDYGPQSAASRHTVHTDINERDPLTRSQLRTVPEGRCRSVRLGNKLTHAEEESITYILKVDTNLFDLILLRYAIVEEDPRHSQAEQPKFLLSVTDSLGMLIDSCYYANLVAGTGDSIWQEGTALVKWRDWTTLGVDLTPLHGRTIHVVLDNYDCSQGGHFGYSYFTLESGFKRLRSAYCGDTDTNIFYAPKGFSYRWYRADMPDSTLGRADSLFVIGEGVYRCRASFTTGDSSCGVTLTTNAGTRFPMAAFSVVPTDSCGYSFKFENHSVVTRDEAHDQPINEACEQYLWRFGDGTTSTAINPSHTFETGTYNVELVAMLANGKCRDSVWQTVIANHMSDTVYDTVCTGGAYLFHNVAYYWPGFYSVEDGCWRHSLQLEQQQYFFQEMEDTICQGEVYWVGDRSFTNAGVYDIQLTSVGGCDSSYLLTLATRPLPVSNYEVARVCRENPYYYLKGRYRSADPSLAEPGSVVFVGEDGLIYRWSASSAVASLPYLTDDGEVRIAPRQQSTYYVQCQYADSPACFVVDTLELIPLKMIVADLEVTPEWLGYDKMDITALDRSRYAAGRRWLVDGEDQNEDGPVLYYTAPYDADSVRVAVVAYNDICVDTAERVIPVLRHMLLFPNVFTPSLSTNNRFGGIGSCITEYELWVFDRRGCLVFHSTDMADTWDGTCNGILCKQEAYAYTCSYTTPTHDRLTMAGVVTLLR